MRTTLTLDEDVAARLKAEMRRTGRSLKGTVNELLRHALVTRKGTRRPRDRFKVRARDLGALRPGLSLDCPWRLLEQVDGPLYR